MDPLSLSASIAAIVTIFGGALKILNGCCSTYATASVIITSICSETLIITTSLAQLQTLIDRQPEVICSQLTSQPQLLTTFDIALTGCKVIATYLESEVRKLSRGSHDARGVAWSAKAKFVLNEDTLKELLQSIRGQQQALTLLIQVIQM